MNMPLRGLSLRIPLPPRSFAFNILTGLEVIYESKRDSIPRIGGA